MFVSRRNFDLFCFYTKRMGAATQPFSRHTKSANIALTQVRNARACSSEVTGRVVALKQPERFQIKGLKNKLEDLRYVVFPDIGKNIPVSPTSFIWRILAITEGISKGRGMEALLQMIGQEKEIERMLVKKGVLIREALKLKFSMDHFMIETELWPFFAELKEYKRKIFCKEECSYLHEILILSLRKVINLNNFEIICLPLYLFALNSMLAILQERQKLGLDLNQKDLEFIAQTGEEFKRRVDSDSIRSSFQGPFNCGDIYRYRLNGVESQSFPSFKRCEEYMNLHLDDILNWFEKEFVGLVMITVEGIESFLESRSS